MGIKVDENRIRDYTSSPYCFSINVAHEITIGGRKIIGVAQVRGERGNLFQASFILEGTEKKLLPVLRKRKIQKELENSLSASL